LTAIDSGFHFHKKADSYLIDLEVGCAKVRRRPTVFERTITTLLAFTHQQVRERGSNRRGSSLESELGRFVFPARTSSLLVTNCEQRKLSNSIGGGSLYGGRARPYDSGSARRALPIWSPCRAALGEFRGALKVSLPNTAETVTNTAKSLMLKTCLPSLRP
jgi:hypothetical protein